MESSNINHEDKDNEGNRRGLGELFFLWWGIDLLGDFIPC
jgi:hypothetical protein